MKKEKTKIYAVTLNPEDFDYRVYDIEDDEGNEVIIDGGREFKDVDSKGYLKAIKQIIKEYNSYLYDCYYHESIMEMLNDMLPKKENGKRLSPKEASEIKNALDEDKDVRTIITCLSIITSKEFKMMPLRGYCQGDYVEAYYPLEPRIHKYLEYVEAWYFGTGIEIMVHEEENEPKKAEEVSGWTFYTSSWKTDDLKAEIKENCGYKRDDDNVEVVLWLYDKTRTIKIDEYKLAD